MILSGFVAIEAVVELRGCGVLFSQMTAASFAIFIPALIGPPARAACCLPPRLGVYVCCFVLFLVFLFLFLEKLRRE